jgi:tricorn protease
MPNVLRRLFFSGGDAPTRLRHVLCVAVLLALTATFVPGAVPAQAQDAPAGVPSFAEPGISPDHSEIAFVSGGDIWSVPAGGGTARLLAATGGLARRPLFSPDGKRLAFVSTRPGANGIYLLTLADGATQRLTHDDVTPDVTGWSADGHFVYFTTQSHNISYFQDVYRVGVAGGTPQPVLHEDYVNAMDAAPSPDGRSIAYARNGFSQWWRRGHSHIDQTEITLDEPATNRFETLTNGEAKERWPMWSPDGQALYFASDRSGSDQLWERAAGHLRQLTQLAQGHVLYPTISRDGKTIAFEREQRIWTCDVASGATRELTIEPRGTPNLPATAHLTATSRFSALSLSPDDKKLAFVVRGHVFATGAEDGGDALAVNSEAGAAADLPVWSHDSRTLAYVVDRGGEQAIALYAFPDGPERMITPAGHHDDYPHWSPDGTSLAFVRDGTELRVYDVATRSEKLLTRGVMDRRPFGDLGDIAYSPAGDWIAYVDQDNAGFSNVRVVPSGGGESHALSFLPNGSCGPLAWAPDGTRLYYVSGQRTEDADVVQIDLIPRAPRFHEDAFRRLFQPEHPELPSHAVPAPVASPAPAPSASSKAKAAKTTRIEFEGIRDRSSPLQTGLDVGRVALTPDGKTLVLIANAAGQTNLYSFPVDETSDEPQVAKQLTNTPSNKSDLSLSSDGHSAYVLAGGRITNVDLGGKGARPLAVAAELDVDFSSDKRLVYAQAWSVLDRWYADPGFHGADWKALRARYLPFALGARSPSEFYRVVSLLIGELNSSHSGIFAPPSAAGPYLGRLGADWDGAAYERDGHLRVRRIVPFGPLAIAGRVAAGDEILSIGGVPLARGTDLDALLAYTIGKRTELRIAPHGDVAAAYGIAVLPVDRSTESQLRYLAWVAGRRAYVERVSGGRVGYVHLADMEVESLKKFYLDLDVQNRARRAVIVDLRNNTGGFVDPYALDVLTRHEYLTFRSRFGYDASARTALGQRVLDRPTALVVNEHSLSDAENFTEGFRVLHAGPIVGEPTACWIIFTSETNLADGSTIRLPSTRVLAHDGVDMELHPRPVDVRVENPPGAAERGEDPQLESAVRELERHTGR